MAHHDRVHKLEAQISELKKERAINRADLREYQRIIQDQSKIIRDMGIRRQYYENPDSPPSKG